jgi:hypothetical protein
MTERGYRRVVITALLIMATPLALSLGAFASGSDKAPFLAAAKAGTQCVMDPMIMRHYHMTYLKQPRDRVVRDGDRSARNGQLIMETCGNCHGNRSEFCDKCHARAGVNLDCFGCHKYGR